MATNVPAEYAQRLQRAADRLFEIPGVISVGLGGKITRGQRTDKLSLTIMVLEKKPAAELAPNEIIPAEIEGFVTDIVQGRPPRPIAEQESPEDFDAGVPRDEAEYPVIVGGIRIRATRSKDFERRKFFGTLGCFVVDKKDANKRYLLTNHHVLADEFGEVNGPSCTGCTKGDGVGNPDTGRQVATVERGKDDEFVDAAIAVLDKGVQFVREIINDNAPNQRELIGPPRILVAHNPPDLNIAVHKRGHRSLLTEAVVGDIVAIMNPKIGKVAKRNQIRIDLAEKIVGATVTFAAGGKMIVDGQDMVAKGVKVRDVAWVDGTLNHGRYRITAVGPPLQPNELIVDGDLKAGGPSRDSFFVTGPMFGLHGDSGSVVLDENSRVVGLLWAADSFGRTGNAWAIPIDAVQTALGVNIDTATNIGDIQVASGVRSLGGPTPALEPAPVMHAAEEASPAAHATLRDRVEQDLLAVPRGRDIHRLYFKHHMEVRELIDRNRRVATVWHRQGGPGMIQSVLDAVRSTTNPVAETIRGRSWAERVSAILDILQRFGSERLRDDIATFGGDIAALGGVTYPAFLKKLDV